MDLHVSQAPTVFGPFVETCAKLDVQPSCERSPGLRAFSSLAPMTRPDPVHDRAERRLGTVLCGKWRLEQVIGVGGMATVFRATHRNQARVAIKLLHPELALNQDVTSRFLREGYVANTVGHAGTVAVLDDDVTEDGAPFLVMELLEGETVEERWARKGERLPLDEALAIAEFALDVLAAAHDRGIVHRDLKPENLFLTSAGQLKILDFGIARLREYSSEVKETGVGLLLGTPAFMAPEQARGRWDEVDGRTDVWAVGATIFTLLSGRFVHEAETVQEQVIYAATLKAPGLAEVCPEVPAAVAAVIDRALAFERERRWSSASEMRQALRAALGLAELDEASTLPVPSSPSAVRAPPHPSGAELARAITNAPTLADPGPPSSVTNTMTGPPVARTHHGLLEARPRRTALYAAAGLAAVVLSGFGVYLAWPAGGATANAGAASTETLPLATTAVPAASMNVAPGPAAPEPPAPAASDVPAPPQPTAKPTAKVGKPPVSPTPFTASPVTTAKPVPSAKTVSPNPFDRRH